MLTMLRTVVWIGVRNHALLPRCTGSVHYIVLPPFSSPGRMVQMRVMVLEARIQRQIEIRRDVAMVLHSGAAMALVELFVETSVSYSLEKL
jgi:hypothetical protein